MPLGQFFMGTPERVEQLQRFTPQQQSALSSLLGMGMQGIQNPYAGFAPISQQARTQFQQQTIPGLAERFTSMGQGSLSSPAFTSQLGQAGAGLEQGLAALQSQYGMQNRNQMMNMAQMGLTPQYENIPLAAQPGLGQQVLPALGRVGMHAGLGALTGGMGAIPGVAAGLGGASSGVGSALMQLLQLLSTPQS